MRFDIDDEDAFHAFRQEVVNRFEAYLEATGRSSDLASDAELMLDWKFGYADGELDWWKTGHLDELLLEWYPRKVASPPEMLELTIPSTAVFLSYLGAHDLLSAASDPLPVLTAHLDDLREPFQAAMQDTSRFGMAKSLFASGDEVPDMSDPAAVQALVDAFNARSFEERDAVLAGPMDAMLEAAGARPQFDPVVLAPPDVLAAAARQALWVRRLLAFTEWAADGQPLTRSTNNITLAGARELLDLLDAPDEMDPQYGDRTFRTTSSTALPTVDLAYRWARAAGLVKVRSGKVSATAHGRDPGDLPALARKALWELLDTVGVLQHHWRNGDTYGFGWYAEAVDDQVRTWLVEVYAAGAFDIERLAEGVWTTLQFEFDLDGVSSLQLTHERESVTRGVRRILDVLSDLGMVEVAGVTTTEHPIGPRAAEEGGTTLTEQSGGTVALTPLGVWALHGYVATIGEAPVVGELANLHAGALLERAADMADGLARAEVEAWVERRGEDAATAELADALTDASQAGLVLGLKALLRIGGSAAPTVGALASDERLAPYVRVWQVDVLATDLDSVRTDDPPMQVGVVGAAVEMWGLNAVSRWLDLVIGSHEVPDIASAVEAWWRVPGDDATEVLELVVRDERKAVSKAARRALFKRRAAGRD